MNDTIQTVKCRLFILSILHHAQIDPTLYTEEYYQLIVEARARNQPITTEMKETFFLRLIAHEK